MGAGSCRETNTHTALQTAPAPARTQAGETGRAPSHHNFILLRLSSKEIIAAFYHLNSSASSCASEEDTNEETKQKIAWE